MFRIGDLVRVKSIEEIQETLDEDDYCDGLDYRNDEMGCFSGKVYKVAEVWDDYESPRYRLLPTDIPDIDSYREANRYTCSILDFAWIEPWLERIGGDMWEDI